MKRTTPPRTLTLADISLHRPVLYGFAALWILFFHMSALPTSTLLLPLRTIQMHGACGVEMFVLLAGFGLYGSLERNPSIGSFYGKRLLRVYLSAVIVAAVHYGLQPGGVLHYGKKCSFLFYWLGDDSFWYVPFILTMYLIYPAIYALQKRSPKALWLLFALSLIPAFLASAIDNSWTEVCLRGVSRIPVFLLGCIAAPKFKEAPAVPRWVMPVLLAASVALLFITTQVPQPAFYFMRTISYICLATSLILLLTDLARFFTRGGVRRFIYRFMALCGSFSLEIYLLYRRIMKWLLMLPFYASGETEVLKMELFGVFLTLLFSLLLSRLCQFIIDSFRSVRIPESD